ADEGVGDVGGDGGALGLVLDVVADGQEVELAAGGVDVAGENGGAGDQGGGGGGRGAQGPPPPGGGGGPRGGGPPQPAGEGPGIVAVALGLAAVDRSHAPGVAEGEGDVGSAAGVGQPVPAVHALAADDQAVAEGLDGAEERLRCGGQVAPEAGVAVAVEDGEV